MSAEEQKVKHSKRMLKEKNAIEKQKKIALQHGAKLTDVQKESHRYAKHHAMDCGNPECGICGNPRHLHKDGLTIQEKRAQQEMDVARTRHGNGTIVNEIDEYLKIRNG